MVVVAQQEDSKDSNKDKPKLLAKASMELEKNSPPSSFQYTYLQPSCYQANGKTDKTLIRGNQFAAGLKRLKDPRDPKNPQDPAYNNLANIAFPKAEWLGLPDAKERGRVIAYRVPRGAADESEPVSFMSEGMKEFGQAYVRFKIFIPADHDYAGEGGREGEQKLVRLTHYSTDKTTGKEVYGPQFNLILQGENNRLLAMLYDPASEKYVTMYKRASDYKGQDDATAIPVNRWVEIGVKVRLDSGGAEDGLMEIYFDGELVASKDKFALRGDGDIDFNLAKIMLNHTNGAEKENNAVLYFDDLEIWSDKPDDKAKKSK